MFSKLTVFLLLALLCSVQCGPSDDKHVVPAAGSSSAADSTEPQIPQDAEVLDMTKLPPAGDIVSTATALASTAGPVVAKCVRCMKDVVTGADESRIPCHPKSIDDKCLQERIAEGYQTCQVCQQILPEFNGNEIKTQVMDTLARMEEGTLSQSSNDNQRCTDACTARCPHPRMPNLRAPHIDMDAVGDVGCCCCQCIGGTVCCLGSSAAYIACALAPLAIIAVVLYFVIKAAIQNSK